MIHLKFPTRSLAAIATGLTLSAASFAAVIFNSAEPAQADTRSLTGVVERVWEDGFRLRVGDRSIKTDTWDVCGDFTARHVQVGDRLTVIGEFEGREFDVFGITNADGERVCR
ncbi:hypothetical protein [Spirulina major]|uniref:hypothetical protein n=1 Tax=Spirulina major TaxID=270636 RepID=UPI000932E342|nr:hypothetical protein [Spirulina major]